MSSESHLWRWYSRFGAQKGVATITRARPTHRATVATATRCPWLSYASHACDSLQVAATRCDPLTTAARSRRLWLSPPPTTCADAKRGGHRDSCCNMQNSLKLLISTAPIVRGGCSRADEPQFQCVKFSTARKSPHGQRAPWPRRPSTLRRDGAEFAGAQDRCPVGGRASLVGTRCRRGQESDLKACRCRVSDKMVRVVASQKRS